MLKVVGADVNNYSGKEIKSGCPSWRAWSIKWVVGNCGIIAYLCKLGCIVKNNNMVKRT